PSNRTRSSSAMTPRELVAWPPDPGTCCNQFGTGPFIVLIRRRRLRGARRRGGRSARREVAESAGRQERLLSAHELTQPAIDEQAVDGRVRSGEPPPGLPPWSEHGGVHGSQHETILGVAQRHGRGGRHPCGESGGPPRREDARVR